ncbi:MAG TPA: protocatechuate 3,4-dioxygenase subunit alpha [Bauldia sp.]|nr:protocatechuate 3,4-dioxygenase subunit alpha [Bauldia sp.]
MSETEIGEAGLAHPSRHRLTPSQTVGPFFAFALTPTAYAYPALAGDDLRTDDAVGEPILIEGRVFDGAGEPIPDAMIEIWQADGAGRYPGAGSNARFKGFGRSETRNGGAYRFVTVKPGAVAGPGGGLQAPHINVGIFARGLLKRLFTRLYFADEQANGSDAILAMVPADRRATLIARRDGTRDGLPRYVLDFRLQGDGETAFFEA